MKSHFIRLFNYNRFANIQIARLVLSRTSAGKPVKLMAHILSAEQVWLKRCKGFDTNGVTSWPDWDADTLNHIINNNHEDWVSWLNGLTETDLEKLIHYQNSTGESFNTCQSDIIAHVVNHGTHTRAQIGQLLKTSEADKLPATDYIFYLRQTNNK